MEENIISDISYTNKDFNTIYPELLDLVKKLTNKWDPSLSNESDPGVLLLKLNAIIADKNNYNIDKNVLECFPLSVTQEGNARKLYDMLGYNMHWYRSATTEIGFQLRDTKNIPTEGLKIPQFKRIVDSSKERVFTILQNVILVPSDTATITKVLAIEGAVLDYKINGQSLVTLNNLDNDLRLYFQDTMVAENGIFIADADNSQSDDYDKNLLSFTNELFIDPVWRRVDNLASHPLGSKVYKFGVLPNSNICYIQFPQDVATLMKNGIYIKYTTTQGSKGNIKSNTLNSFYDNIIGAGDGENKPVVNDNIRIYQYNGTTNGEDPETISDAYRNYKRTVGTFNNLVTRRDYENYIYNLKEQDKNIVSNIKVTDRTNDINYSNCVQVWDPTGNRKELVVAKDITSKQPVLNAYNIVMYMTQAQDKEFTQDDYDMSFKPDAQFSTLSDIKYAIGDIQSVQHDILQVTADELPNSSEYGTPSEIPTPFKKFNVNNTFAIRGSLITYNKITKSEAKEIEDNVRKALMKKYSCHNVEYGNKIEYEELLSTIKSADTRIKNVYIDIPTYSPQYNILEQQESKQLSPKETNNTLNNELVARMVVAGNVQLFKFDDNFVYEFGQTAGTPIESKGKKYIKSITSKVDIDLSKTTEIKENEIIQVVKPNLVPLTEYGAYVQYYLSSSAKTAIEPNTNYELKDSEYLHIKYVEKNQEKELTLNPGTIITSNVKIDTLVDSTIQKEVWKTLRSSQYIREMGLNKTILKGSKIQGKGTPHYFLLNNPTNTLDIKAGQSYILQENEYFIYTSSDTSELIILGSGTQLSSNSNIKETIERRDIEKLTKENIEEIDWLYLTSDLTIIEMKIDTLGSGTKVTTANPDSMPNYTIDNTLKDLTYDIVWENKEDKSSGVISHEIIKGIPTLIQSRLFINANQYNPQELIKETGHTQSMEISLIATPENDTTTVEKVTLPRVTDTTPLQVVFNNPVKLSGGVNLDMKVLDESGNNAYTLQGYTYNSTKFSSLDTITEREPGGQIEISKNTMGTNTSVTFNYTFKGDATYLIPMLANLSGAATVTIDRATIFQEETPETANVTLKGVKGSYIVRVKTGDNLKVTIDKFSTSDFVLIGNINVIKNDVYDDNGALEEINMYNASEINSEDRNEPYNIYDKCYVDTSKTNIEDIIDKIKKIIDTTQFDWTYRVPEEMKVLHPTEANSYWNSNHIYNEYTLPKIDFRNTTIRVNASTVI